MEPDDKETGHLTHIGADPSNRQTTSARFPRRPVQSLNPRVAGGRDMQAEALGGLPEPAAGVFTPAGTCPGRASGATT